MRILYSEGEPQIGETITFPHNDELRATVTGILSRTGHSAIFEASWWNAGTHTSKWFQLEEIKRIKR